MPVGVMKHTNELGIQIEDRNSPFDRDIHAAGVKSALMRKHIDSDHQTDGSQSISISKQGQLYQEGEDGFANENKSTYELSQDYPQNS